MAEAERQFGLARVHCEGCREYHAVWPYEWLARPRTDGVAVDREILSGLLADHCPAGGRLLIGGSADSRLLALAYDSTRDRSVRFSVTDRCRTPLLVCRRFADERGLAVDTHQTDLTQVPPARDCDIVVAHNVLRWLSPSRHGTALRSLAHSVAPGGTLILVTSRNTVATGAEGVADYIASFPQRVVDGLVLRGVRLPEPVADFHRRLSIYVAARNERLANVVDPDEVVTELSQAGLCVDQRISRDRPASLSADTGELVTARASEIFVATRPAIR